MSQFRLGPLFTSPALRGTLQRPRIDGWTNWGGAGFDQETGLLFVRSFEGTTANQVCEVLGDDRNVDVDYSNNRPNEPLEGSSVGGRGKPKSPGVSWATSR